ncbi:PREDICTED: non-functional pseudokinase ZED1-like [Tarenaya hassleriana]|uniref:non-functional pseudokinase ZED1-like n=1 Tax=Tarenaya hassleriana TaxID=28532 RepID=UPI00053C6973|nr:PREDICTED: non-functional pseudokinase ZED1-like [Tarenaya hassleriana]
MNWVLLLLKMVRWRRKSSGASKRKRSAGENGRVLLQELVECCDGKSNPIKAFTAVQIMEATDNFSHENLVHSDRFQCYRGMLEGRLVKIKTWPTYGCHRDKVCRDIAVSSMVSGHKNFLKLLGCCLEFDYPVLVCEYSEGIVQIVPPPGIGKRLDPALTWKMKMKIAKEIATAVTYLHTTFPRTIVHKNLKPCKVSLDVNGTAKLSDFANCVSIPLGKSFVEDDRVEGTYGFVDPDYMSTGTVTEKTDVYSFGVFMRVLLTGKAPCCINEPLAESLSKLVEDDRILEIVDPTMLRKMGSVSGRERRQMEALVILSLRCTGHRGEVPKMIEVAKELKMIERYNMI